MYASMENTFIVCLIPADYLSGRITVFVNNVKEFHFSQSHLNKPQSGEHSLEPCSPIFTVLDNPHVRDSSHNSDQRQ